MTAVSFFAFFLASGILIARRLFVRQPAVIQGWAGMVIGMTGLMWGVVPFAFLWGFSPVSHGCAVLAMAALTLLILRSSRSFTPPEPAAPFPRALYVIIGLVSAVCMVLFFQQILLPREDGLFVGPSTYGDLPVHLAMITGIAEQRTFPPENPVFSGARLFYPFLNNSLSASLYLFGLSLRWAILLPSFVQVLIVVIGFAVFSQEVLKRSRAAGLAVLLFFFSGGFGFCYFLEDLRKHPENFLVLLSGQGPGPANIGEKNILMWNVICHILVPQRTSLAGWGMLFFILWLLHRGMGTRQRKYFVLGGILGGLLPMIHTASFFILLVIAAVWFVVYLFPEKAKSIYLRNWALWLIPLAVLSVPQVLVWVLPQASSGHFMHWRWNAINERDLWLWFWVKNGGVVFLTAFPALLAASRDRWRFYAPAVVLFLIGESFQLGPWSPDNNKVLFLWYAFTVILVSGYVFDVFDQLRGRRERWLLVGTFVFLGIFSGALTVAHDMRASYRVSSKVDIAVADFVRDRTPADAVFVSAMIHNNPVSTLGGRKRVCGDAGILFSHGVPYQERESDVRAMYVSPERFPALAEKYKIDYVYFSETEQGMYHKDNKFFEENYPRKFSAGDAVIYAVSQRARMLPSMEEGH